MGRLGQLLFQKQKKGGKKAETMTRDTWAWGYRFYEQYAALLSDAVDAQTQADLFAEALPAVKAVADQGEIEMTFAIALWEMLAIIAKRSLEE